MSQKESVEFLQSIDVMRLWVREDEQMYTEEEQVEIIKLLVKLNDIHYNAHARTWKDGI